MRGISFRIGPKLDLYQRVFCEAIAKRPLLWCAGGAIAGILVADGECALGLTLAAGLSAIIAFTRRWKICGAFWVVVLLAGVLHYQDLSQRTSFREAVSEGVNGVILDDVFLGEIIAEPRVNPHGWTALARQSEGPALWVVARGQAPARGATVTMTGNLEPIRKPRNPGVFDFGPWLDRQGAAAVFRASDGFREVRAAPGWTTWGEQLRVGFRSAITRGLEEESEVAAVIRAVAIGERPNDSAITEPFRLSGTLHLFAVSGLHVGMVGLLAWVALRFSGISRRAAVVPLIAILFSYAWLTGLNPPAVRAAWMAVIVLGAFIFRRRPDMGNSLGAAALLLLIYDGDQLFRPGVQLSFGVVAAIGLLHPLTAKAFYWLKSAEPYLPRSLYGRRRAGWLWVRSQTADSLTVSTSAWLGSAPLTALIFGLVTPISVVASVVLFTLVFPLLALSLISGICAPLPYVSHGVNRVTGTLASAVVKVAAIGASVPGGHFKIPLDRPAKAFAIVYDLGGNGAICWHDHGATLLIDAGSERDFEYRIGPSLDRMALVPTAFVATHPDGGHAGGLVGVCQKWPIAQGLLPVVKARSTSYQSLSAVGGELSPKLLLGESGRLYPLARGAHLEVLHPPQRWADSVIADDRAMPVRLNWRGWKLLIMSDAGSQTERALLQGGADLSADVVIAGRHQFDDSLTQAFLQATGARAVIVTHTDFPAGQRVPQRWRKVTEAAGLAVFHQGESGAVVLTIDDNHLGLRGFFDGRELQLRK